MGRLPLNPRVAITGAGGGFGRALALELARTRNASLFVSDRDAALAEETAELARSAGAKEARAMGCDVTRLGDVEDFAEAAGAVDLVVNNAGVSSAGLVGESPLEDWRWTIEVDLWGVIHGCHVFVPILKRRGSGHILNVASAAGLLAAPTMGAYNVAKAGVVALSETLAGELAGTRVGITVVCPTFFKTGIASGGRFANERLRASAQKLVGRGLDAETVARRTIASVDAGELYALPMVDARVMWGLKRTAPEGFRRFLGLAYRRFMLA